MNIDLTTISFYIVIFATGFTAVFMLLASLDVGLYSFALFAVALLVLNAWFVSKIISEEKQKEEIGL